MYTNTRDGRDSAGAVPYIHSRIPTRAYPNHSIHLPVSLPSEKHQLMVASCGKRRKRKRLRQRGRRKGHRRCYTESATDFPIINPG
jgi:hypothetical protein